jgi:hypothetical protein
MAISQNEALAEAYRRDLLKPEQRAAVEELGRRGVLNLGPATTPRTDGDLRSQLMQEMAEEVGPLEAFTIGAGKGAMNLVRGIVPDMLQPAFGVPEEQPEDIAGYEALTEARPYTTGAGEIVGETAPFMVPGAQIGKIASRTGRVLGSGALGATEGAIVAEGRGGDALVGAGVGGTVGVGAELLFPVVGRMGRKIYQKTMGRAPRGAMLDAAGKPTPELSEALQKAGISFEDLTQDATEVISGAKPGTKPEQLARKALFAEEGIPATTGEIAGDTLSRAKEQELIQTMTPATEEIRKFKLDQSDKIKESLEGVFGGDISKEETGGLIQDALTGKKKLLRARKNELYGQAAEASKDVGGVPVFSDTITDAIPDADLMEDLAITAPQAIGSLDQILTKYGLKEPTEESIKAGFNPTPLTVENVERFRKTLNAISKGDQTGAARVAIGPIKQALDVELDDLAGVLAEKGVKSDIVKPLKAARETVRQLKTEFSPQSITGKIIGKQKDGFTQITEASKVYDKMMARSMPVENIRKVMRSLKTSPNGEQAAASIQASTMLDLIDAGFSTKSRKIGADIVFNPVAFKNRIKNISPEKLKAIFGNNPEVLKKINNIDKISSELIPPDMTVLKGSAPMITKLADQLGFYTLTAKVPGGAMLAGALKGMTDPIKQGAAVKTALKAAPEVEAVTSLIERQFPGIASAMAIPATVGQIEEDRL